MVSGAAMGGKYYRGGMRIMPKNAERLFNLPEDNHDDRNVAQQMNRLQLYQSGLNDVEIAIKLGVNPNTITTWRRRKKLPRNYQPMVKVEARPENERRLIGEFLSDLIRTCDRHNLKLTAGQISDYMQYWRPSRAS
jgi:hypothetical protein